MTDPNRHAEARKEKWDETVWFALVLIVAFNPKRSRSSVIATYRINLKLRFQAAENERAFKACS